MVSSRLTLWNWLALCFVFVCVFFLFFRPIETSDVWWHLKTGEWIVEHGQIPDYDIFSPIDHPAQDISYQWLGSVFYFLAYKFLGGLNGLKFFRAVLFVLIVLIPTLLYRQRVPFWVLLSGLFLMVHGLLSRYDLRPYVFNFIFIQLLLILCLCYENSKNWKYLLPIPIIGLFWFNVHMGSVFYGIPILIAFLISCGISYAQSSNASSEMKLPTASNGVSKWNPFRKSFIPEMRYPRCKHRGIASEINDKGFYGKSLKYLCIALIGYVFSFCINPYGFEGLIYPFRVFLDPQFVGFYNLGSVIVELQPPLFIFSPEGWWVHLLFLFALLSLIFDKQRKFSLVILFIFSSFFFLRYARTGPFFVLISLYSIFDSAPKILSTIKIRPGIQIALCMLLLFLLGHKTLAWAMEKVRTQDGEAFYLTRQLEPNNPEAALQYMRKHGLKGRIFNSASYGGYLIWKSYPEIKPFADTRQYDMNLFTRYLSILRNSGHFWPEAIRDFDFQIVLLDLNHRASREFLKYLKKRQDWVLIFFDYASAIYIRRDHPAFVHGKVTPLESFYMAFPIDPSDLEILKAVASGQWHRRRGPQAHYVDVQDFQEGMVLLTDFGYKGIALQKIVKALPYFDPSYAQTVSRAVLEFLSSSN